MIFFKFKENVKQLLLDKSDVYNEKYKDFIENYSVSTQAKYNHLLVDFAKHEATIDNGAELYTVVNDDSDDAVRNFFLKNGGDWAKLKDENGAIAVAFGVARVPETWVIDPNGLVRLRVTGELSEGLLEAQLDKLREEFTS
jgi:hypothetical protein